MIEWNSIEDFEQRLAQYPPIGLRLRPWFHARCDADPTTTINRASEVRDEEGLGPVNIWSGFVDTLPFSIRSRHNPYPQFGFGFEVAFPVRPGANMMLLSALRKLPFPAWRAPYFDQFPIDGGFAVARLGDDTPIYTSSSQLDATAVADFVSLSTEGQYVVIPVGSSDPCWMVVGPAAGPYISWLETMSSEADAKRQAAKCSAATGIPFDVRRHL